MAGYLDQYGAGDERREKFRKRVLISLLVLLVAGGAAFFLFRNHRQERLVASYFDLLARKDYQAAYRLWGCTPERPCRDYIFERFMEDWGPSSPRSDVAHAKVERSFPFGASRSCGSGVIVGVHFGKGQEEKLWVERKDSTIGFSPYPGCPPGM